MNRQQLLRHLIKLFNYLNKSNKCLGKTNILDRKKNDEIHIEDHRSFSMLEEKHEERNYFVPYTTYEKSKLGNIKMTKADQRTGNIMN